MVVGKMQISFFGVAIQFGRVLKLFFMVFLDVECYFVVLIVLVLFFRIGFFSMEEYLIACQPTK